MIDAVIGHAGKVVGAGILTALGVAWVWLWHHFNPQFEYRAPPSALPSHFVSLGQILNQIDKDSHLYCTGGWDQRLAKIGLRACYHFSFVPAYVYNMMICTHDQRTAEVSTSDQLIALQYFEGAFRPLACFSVTKKVGNDDYDIGLGKDANVRSITYRDGSTQQSVFCGCDDHEVDDVAKIMGATAN